MKHRILGTVAMLLIAASAFAEDCLHMDPQADDQRIRREAAIRYVRSVNTTQARMQAQRGVYVPLTELPGLSLASVPIGFVPRLLFDRWHYSIKLSDFFDPCGFTLFSDESGLIYESHPRAVAPDASKDPVEARRPAEQPFLQESK